MRIMSEILVMPAVFRASLISQLRFQDDVNIITKQK